MIQITLSENQDRNKKSMTKSSLILLMPRIVVSTVSTKLQHSGWAYSKFAEGGLKTLVICQIIQRRKKLELEFARRLSAN